MDIDEQAFQVGLWAAKMLPKNVTSVSNESTFISMSNLNVQMVSKKLYSFLLTVSLNNKVISKLKPYLELIIK